MRHMTPESLSQMLSDFLAGAHAAIVVEDAAVAFDLADATGAVERCRRRAHNLVGGVRGSLAIVREVHAEIVQAR